MLSRIDDTIAAIATAPGEAGLCVIRISGKCSLFIADQIFKGRIIPSKSKSHTVHYGHINDPQSRENLDEVLLTVMRSPRTYTCEDVVEISCHGGDRPGAQILDLLFKCGARLADPGEFTKRAFLNGRLDLLQAEAVADIIRSRTNAASRAALRQLSGSFSSKVNRVRDQLIHLLALVEVGLDFTEEGIQEFESRHLLSLAHKIADDIRHISSIAHSTRILRNGARIALIGKPNVGKSSLLNALLQRNRAIVDAIPGTTRDTIEETLDLRGLPVVLIDTAGIRSPTDAIEALGIHRTEHEIGSADFFIWILDNSSDLQDEDFRIYKIIDLKRTIPVINKIDMASKLDISHLKSISSDLWVPVSVLHEQGLESLKDILFRKLSGSIDLSESDIIINARHADHLHQASHGIDQAILLLETDIGCEIVAIELRTVLHHISEILGITLGDDILDRIFSSFCIGK